MNEKIETQGKTVDDAVNEALLRLGARRDEVDVTVLDEPKSGFLGLLGGRPAKVEVTRKRSHRRGQRRDQGNNAAHEFDDGSGSNRGRSGGRNSRGGSRRNEQPQRGAAATREERSSTDGNRRGDNQQKREARGGDRRPRNQRSDQQPGRNQDGRRSRNQEQSQSRAQENTPESTPERAQGEQKRARNQRRSRPVQQERTQPQNQPAPEPQAAQSGQERQLSGGRRGRGDRNNRSRRPQNSQRSVDGNKYGNSEGREINGNNFPQERDTPAGARVYNTAPDEIIATGISAGKYAKPIRDIDVENLNATLEEMTNGLLARAGFPARCEVSDGEYRQVRVITDDDSAGMLIGRHGATIDSVEHLVERMVSNAAGDRVRMNLDINNYRLRRHESLLERVEDAVNQVRENGKTYHVEPMNARERRIVHLAVEEYDDMRTFTMDSHRGRHVVIAVDKGDNDQVVADETSSPGEISESPDSNNEAALGDRPENPEKEDRPEA